jgi:hypothetical protein
MRKRMMLGIAIAMAVLVSPVGKATAQNVIELNNPTGEHKLGKVDGGGRYVLKGKIGKLIVGELNGGCEFDASGLEAGEIVFGLVDGATKLTLKATGNVTFTDKIDGKSHVEVTTTGDVSVAKKVDGKSDLIVHLCRNFKVGEKIDGGPDTWVKVSYFGSAEVPEVNGKARYETSKVNPPK